MEQKLIWEKSLETKSVIRKILLQRRRLLSKEEYSQNINIITQKVLTMKEFVECENLLIYSSYDTEVGTKQIIEEAWKKSKNVFCPRVLPECQMEFYQITSFEELKEGYKGIREPSGDTLFTAKNGLMILPMTGFDVLKNRLGYGKGYYDRYLSRKKEIITMGIAFQCQKWEQLLPVNEFDIPLRKIITEKNIY